MLLAIGSKAKEPDWNSPNPMSAAPSALTDSVFSNPGLTAGAISYRLFEAAFYRQSSLSDSLPRGAKRQKRCRFSGLHG
jgi:hypothetical protein